MMHRRAFLGLGAAMLGSTLLTNISFAQEIEQADTISAAISGLQRWHFYPAGVAMVFGYPPYVFETIEALANAVQDAAYNLEQQDMSDRIDLVLALRGALFELYGSDAEKQAKWLDRPHRALNGLSPRYVMLGRRYDGLQKVVMIALDESSSKQA